MLPFNPPDSFHFWKAGKRHGDFLNIERKTAHWTDADVMAIQTQGQEKEDGVHRAPTHPTSITSRVTNSSINKRVQVSSSGNTPDDFLNLQRVSWMLCMCGQIDVFLRYSVLSALARTLNLELCVSSTPSSLTFCYASLFEVLQTFVSDSNLPLQLSSLCSGRKTQNTSRYRLTARSC